MVKKPQFSRESALFSSRSWEYRTPLALRESLNAEFGFTLDPCPFGGGSEIMENDGLARSWAGQRVYCNPPYGRSVAQWLAKAREASLAVFLLPARTDTGWWHDYAMDADEIRFIRGRLCFNGKGRAPFPSVILIFRDGPV